jgi:hypothetical protein
MTVEMARDGGAAWRSDTFAELEYTFHRLPGSRGLPWQDARLVMVTLTKTNSTALCPGIAKYFWTPDPARVLPSLHRIPTAGRRR